MNQFGLNQLWSPEVSMLKHALIEQAEPVCKHEPNKYRGVFVVFVISASVSALNLRSYNVCTLAVTPAA